MTEQKLRKLSRMELLEMLLEQNKEVERLRQENQRLVEQLESRRIMIDEAGSIAEAAMELNQIFEIAQQTADQYLQNVRQLCEEKAGKGRTC